MHTHTKRHHHNSQATSPTLHAYHISVTVQENSFQFCWCWDEPLWELKGQEDSEEGRKEVLRSVEGNKLLLRQ